MLQTLTKQGMRLCRELLGLQGRSATVGDLAEVLGMSPRMVKYEAQSVRDWLGRRGLALRVEPARGLWVEGEIGSHQKELCEDTKGVGVQVPIGDGGDRPCRILEAIFFAGRPPSVSDICRALDVSERTVYYDLKTLRAQLGEHGILISSNRGRLKVAGEEVTCRTVVVQYISAQAELGDVLRALSPPTEPSAAKISNHGTQTRRRPYGARDEEFSRKELLEGVQRVSSSALATFGLDLDRHSEQVLCLHILATVCRVRGGFFVDDTGGLVERLSKRPEWDVAVWLVLGLEREFGIRIPASEAAYFALHLTGPEFQRVEFGQDHVFLVSQAEVAGAATKIVKQLEASLDVDLSTDTELLSGLMAHLYMSLEKIRAGILISNPLLDEVKASYPTMFRACLQVLRGLSEFGIQDIREEEAAFITLHIGASLERRTRQRSAWRGLIVCPNGVGVGRLLESRLQTHFPQAILSAVAVSPNLRAIVDACEADVVISTIEVPGARRPVVRVGALLGAEDVRRISEVVCTRGNPTEHELLFTNSRHKDPVTLPSHGADGSSSVLPLITPQTVRVAPGHIHTAEEAIRMSGSILLECGLVTERYVESMVDIYRSLGPYIVVVPGVAIPHAKPEDGAIGLGLGVLVLAEPVAFGAKDNDPVKAVISLASPDYCAHVDALLELFALLRNGLNTALSVARTVEDVLEAFKERCESCSK